MVCANFDPNFGYNYRKILYKTCDIWGVSSFDVRDMIRRKKPREDQLTVTQQMLKPLRLWFETRRF